MFRDSSLVYGVRTALLSDTQNYPEISGFSTVHAYKYKTNRQALNESKTKKFTFLLASHQSTLVPEKLRSGYRPQTSKENRNVVHMFCNTGNHNS